MCNKPNLKLPNILLEYWYVVDDNKVRCLIKDQLYTHLTCTLLIFDRKT